MISRQRNQLVAEVRAFGEYANPLMMLRGNTIVSKWPANKKGYAQAGMYLMYLFEVALFSSLDRKGNYDVAIIYYETPIEFSLSGKTRLTSLMNHSPKRRFERQIL